jgi:hypothetical protein
MKYIVFERKTGNTITHFALTNEQMNDARNKVLFEGNVTEFARVNTVAEMKALNTPKRISYLRNGKVLFA